jgi:predicted nucleic acid-binding protein
MRNRGPAYLCDTVTLSNFALVGRFELLVKRYGRRLQVTPAVLGEVAEGIIAGYAALREIETAVDEGRITQAGDLTSVDDRRTYRDLLRILAPGEASCIAHAGACGGVVISDDRTARQCCEARGIEVTGTVGILKACTHDRTLSPEEADSVLHAMVDAGYYSPVRSIGGLA